jgi:tRNA uridine 5-carboxymethylaminomethyl modification enzyme
MEIARLAQIWGELSAISPKVAEALEIEAGYAVYMDRQANDIRSAQRDEALVMPDNFDFDSISGLSNELKLKLRRAQPRTIAQAAKIEGMTPAAVTLLLALVRKAEKNMRQAS